MTKRKVNGFTRLINVNVNQNDHFMLLGRSHIVCIYCHNDNASATNIHNFSKLMDQSVINILCVQT